MRNRYILTIATCLSLFVFACKTKDESAFTISGNITNASAVKKVELLRLDSTDLSVVDTAVLGTDGKFSFKQVSPYTNLYRLRLGDNQYDFLAINGNEIELTADASKGNSGFKVEGAEETEAFTEFNKISGETAAKNTKLGNEFDAKVQQLGQAKSDSLINIYRPVFQQNLQNYNKALIAFINRNKDKIAAFYAATAVDPREYEQQLIAYADDIKDKFPNNPMINRFVKQMMRVKPVSVGQKAQDFTIPGFDGKSINLADYKGKYVMLDFWASWCGPCRQENPNVVKQYNIYHPKGLEILGISLDDDKAKWQSAILADGLLWKHASNLQSFNGPVERLYQVEAIPSNFIIDPQGVIVAKNITGLALEEFLKKTFN